MTKSSVTIRKKADSQKEIALIYYNLISKIYNIPLTETEIALLAHTAMWSTITTPPAREEFIKEYSSSKASVNNMISKLQKRGLLIKDKNLKIRVLPKIAMDFTKQDYMFHIQLMLEEKEVESAEL